MAGCAGNASTRPEPELDRGALRAWGGARTSSATTEGAVSDPEKGSRDARTAIELAGGARFEALVALTVFRVRPREARSQPSVHCSVYVLQPARNGLAEGRRAIPCPVDGLDQVRPSDVPVDPVDESRRRRLEAVLSGARASAQPPGEPPRGAAPGRVDYAVTVRVRTERGAIEGKVPPPAWPPPGAKEPLKSLDRKPRGLTELWEAVMYPGRYGG